jgi:hypothetical protein
MITHLIIVTLPNQISPHQSEIFRDLPVLGDEVQQCHPTIIGNSDDRFSSDVRLANYVIQYTTSLPTF